MGAAGFGARLLQARMELAKRRGSDVRKADVARAMGVSGVSVGRWESGEKEPDLATIERLADFLEVSAGWLAFAEEPHIIRRGMLPTPGEDFENVTRMPKQKKTEARRQKRA
jgi:transcriptional regulator with XRE-family HTH domain